MNTCPQCGAPIEPYQNRCPYCGVYYFDLSAFDCSKKCYVKFRTNIGGQECIITALAQPKLEEAIVSSYTNEMRDIAGNLLGSYVKERTCNLKATFTCLVDPTEKSLFRIDVTDSQD